MRSWHCIDISVFFVCLWSSAAWGQCAACSNPNLGGGGADLALALDRGEATTRIRSGLSWAYVSSPDVFAGTQRVDNAERRSSTVNSFLLSVDAEHRSGFGLSTLLPAGTVVSRVNGREYRDTGMSDLELRTRQDVWALFGPSRLRLVPALGLAMPTGTYTRSRNLANTTNQYASLGRGAWWLLADLDATVRLPASFTLLTGLSLRSVLDAAPDGFQWGREVRARLGGAYDLGRVQVALALDQLWREQSTELFAGQRIDSISTGGSWLGLTAAVRVNLGKAWALSVGTRIPLRRDVRGLQNVEGLNGFVTLAWTAEP
jgi:hypothetical protein